MRNEVDKIEWPIVREILKFLSDNNKIAFVIVKDKEHVSDVAMQQLILKNYHGAPTGGHLGIRKMYSTTKRY